MRLRLFPILIVVACIALVGKLGGFWVESGALAQSQDSQTPDETAANGESGQGTEPSDAEAMAEASAAENDDSEAQGEAASPEDSQAEDDEAGSELAEAVPEFQKAPLSADPFDLSDEEIDLLQALAKRRGELERRDREIDQREAMLAAAEARIEARVAELEELGREIQALLEEHDAKNAERILSLVRIYELMKPKDAARIFEKLDMEVLLDVIDGMQERKSATILAQMDPKRAQAITLQLAQRNTLPMPRE